MTPSQKVVLLAVSVPFVALTAWLVYHETRIPQNQAEVLNRMIELQKEGRYDKAAQVVQNWMNDRQRDISHDGLMYDQIAMLYIMKAYKRPRSREDSIHRAEEDLEKELSLFERQNHDDLSVDLFDIGRAYEALGDISDTNKCRFYRKAGQALERQLPLIKGDSYTSYGYTTQLEPLRAEIRKHIEAINGKYLAAACQPH